MKNQTAGLIVVLALLWASGMALSWAAPALAQTGGPGPVPAYVVQAGTTAGGGYQLTSLPLRQAQGGDWRVSGIVGGGTYRLAGSGPWGQCCCTYLPIMLRNR